MTAKVSPSVNKYIAFFLLTIFVTVNLRPVPASSSDYLIRYQQFLNYSLKAFEVLVDGEVQGWDVSPKTWMVWELQYTHENGDERNLRLSRGTGIVPGSTPVFGRQVLHHALIHAGIDIKQDVARQYFPDEALVDMTVLYSQFFNTQVVRSNSNLIIMGRINNGCYTCVSHPRNGLKLYSVTAQALVSDWDVEFAVALTIRDDAMYEEMVEQLKAMTRTLANDLSQDEVEIFVRFRSGEADLEDLHLIYNRQDDDFERIDGS